MLAEHSRGSPRILDSCFTGHSPGASVHLVPHRVGDGRPLLATGDGSVRVCIAALAILVLNVRDFRRVLIFLGLSQGMLALTCALQAKDVKMAFFV